MGEVKERSPLFNGEARKKLIERVYRSSFQKLCWFSYTIAEDMETAEELTTEAFVRLMEHQKVKRVSLDIFAQVSEILV